MSEQEHIGQELMEEIGRYLAAVDLFRAEGCEPMWRPELAPSTGPAAPDTRARGAVRSDVGLH